MLALKTVPSFTLTRALQKLILTEDPDIPGFIINTLHDIPSVMKDTYGNYLMQHIFTNLNLRGRLAVLKIIRANFTSIAIHPSGTHSLQCLIQLVQTDEELSILKESIEGDLFLLMTDNHATHIIQKLIGVSVGRNSQYLEIFSCENKHLLAKDRNGVCIIKQLLSESGSEFLRKEIIRYLVENCLDLAIDSFGNYLIQYVLESSMDEEVEGLVERIIENCFELALNRSGSNVVEKVIERRNSFANYDLTNIILDKGRIANLLSSKFGTFTLRKLIILSDEKNILLLKTELVKQRNNCDESDRKRIDELLNDFK